MIKNVSLILSIGILYACTSPEKETSGGVSDSFYTFEKRERGSFIAEDITTSVTSKRRGKLSNLYPEGPAWFSIEMPYPDKELKIAFDKREFVWVIDPNDTTGLGQKLILQAPRKKAQILTLDIFIGKEDIRFYFNKGVQSFIFKANKPIPDHNRIALFLDGVPIDAPAVLYDIEI